MKKLAKLSLALLIQGLISLPAAHAAVSIDSTGVNLTPGSTLALNVNIDLTGAVTTPSPLFALSGSLSEPGAFGGTVGVTFDAAKDMSTNSLDLTIGNELIDGNLNSDGNGFLGVTGNPNGTGTGSDGITHEGITILFDELTGIDPSVGVRITGINVQNVGRTSGTTDPADESFTLVNLLTHASITYIPVAQGLSAGTFDVSSLNIYRVGGDPGEVAAIVSGDVGGFRIDGFTFETFAVPEPSTFALLGLGGMLLMLRKRISLRG